MKVNFGIVLLLMMCWIQSPVSRADTDTPEGDTGNQNQSTSTVTPDNRLTKRLGAYVGVLGDPHPTLFGFNVAYNVLDYLRASIGYGSVSVGDLSLTTIGAAAKFMVPGWNLSPTGTLGYSHVSMNGFVADYGENNIYVGLGGDWQAGNGFNLGAGFNVSLNGAAPTAPYLNVGMFF